MEIKSNQSVRLKENLSVEKEKVKKIKTGTNIPLDTHINVHKRKREHCKSPSSQQARKDA